MVSDVGELAGLLLVLSAVFTRVCLLRARGRGVGIFNIAQGRGGVGG